MSRLALLQLDKVNKHHSVYKRDMAALKERFEQVQRDLEARDTEVVSCRQRIDQLSTEVGWLRCTCANSAQ